MKVVHSWIRDLVDLPDDVEAISFTLSDIGLAVESVDKVGATVAGVITARVIKTERHPDAAKVHRVFLDKVTAPNTMCGAELSICSLATSFRGQLPELQCLMVDSLKLSQLWVSPVRECVARLANLGLVTITAAFSSWIRQRRSVFRMVKPLA